MADKSSAGGCCCFAFYGFVVLSPTVGDAPGLEAQTEYK